MKSDMFIVLLICVLFVFGGIYGIIWGTAPLQTKVMIGFLSLFSFLVLIDSGIFEIRFRKIKKIWWYQQMGFNETADLIECKK